jgi:hypothetical protein
LVPNQGRGSGPGFAPPDALSWSAEASSVRTGNDSELEALLNEMSLQCWKRTDPALQEQFAAYVMGFAHQAAATVERSRTLQALRTGRLAWRPGGVAHLSPVPWAARAFALEHKVPAHMETLLRGCMICAPVAKEVVSRCLDLEAYVRAWHGSDLVGPFPEPATEQLASFERRSPQVIESRFYPANSPAAVLVDATAFMTFGEFLAQLQPKGGRKDALHRLRRLRNSVAHGDYVSWESLKLLEELEGLLA